MDPLEVSVKLAPYMWGDMRRSQRLGTLLALRSVLEKFGLLCHVDDFEDMENVWDWTKQEFKELPRSVQAFLINAVDGAREVFSPSIIGDLCERKYGGRRDSPQFPRRRRMGTGRMRAYGSDLGLEMN